ncbi:unnamed protein product [Microthlaspi erraticum]|uniref:MULE transposase domain-containing protein n=1 Tax=Microthlaspi erraticum TaxID=1685480 RepID=A0A6D2KXJ0_9BRAS|nr:unnamed protein product [Microthlaspi erraticum]
MVDEINRDYSLILIEDQCGKSKSKLVCERKATHEAHFASKPGSAMEKETVPGPTPGSKQRIVSIAWAVVDVDNYDNWDWFVKHLKADLSLGNRRYITIISDKQKFHKLNMVCMLFIFWETVKQTAEIKD